MPRFQAPVGTRDIMPPESARWERLVGVFRARVEAAGYGLVLSPMFEDIAVFERVGGATDVVTKEMYDFADKGGRRVALRPEGTASVVRAWVQHRPPLPFKAWYAAPSFRYERPQAGRYRQHHQLGIEALGTDDPELDVEVIALAWGVVADLGLERVGLALNSLGDAESRPRYVAAMWSFMKANRKGLCEEHRRRTDEADATGTVPANPLRVLDCKRTDCRNTTESAPRSIDFLSDAAAADFGRVTDGLGSVGIDYRIEPRLVRGLDYYTRTIFELVAEDLDAAQNGIGGGGRYDGLVEALGGPPTPGIGFGMGMERLLLACDAESKLKLGSTGVDVWVVDSTGGSEATKLVHRLRTAGVSCDRSFNGRSMKAQFRGADRSGAVVALVLGPREVAAGEVSVQLLREDSPAVVVGAADVVGHVVKILAGQVGAKL